MYPENVAWVDKDYRVYEMNEISDEYLVNILRFIANGGGYSHFIDEDKIKDLIMEAFDRELIGVD